MDKLDFYGAHISRFNFEGRNRIHSPIGIFCSVFTLIILAFYTMNAFIHIFVGYAPSFSVMDDLNMFLTEKDAYSLNHDGF